jgi:hypothetical protein
VKDNEVIRDLKILCRDQLVGLQVDWNIPQSFISA